METKDEIVARLEAAEVALRVMAARLDKVNYLLQETVDVLKDIRQHTVPATVIPSTPLGPGE